MRRRVVRGLVRRVREHVVRRADSRGGRVPYYSGRRGGLQVVRRSLFDDGNPGCYDVSIHECDCTIMSEEDCPAPMVWTSGCASCAGGDDGGDESDSATRAVLAAAAVVAALVF